MFHFCILVSYAYHCYYGYLFSLLSAFYCSCHHDFYKKRKVNWARCGPRLGSGFKAATDFRLLAVACNFCRSEFRVSGSIDSAAGVWSCRGFEIELVLGSAVLGFGPLKQGLGLRSATTMQEDSGWDVVVTGSHVGSLVQALGLELFLTSPKLSMGLAIVSLEQCLRQAAEPQCRAQDPKTFGAKCFETLREPDVTHCFRKCTKCNPQHRNAALS